MNRRTVRIGDPQSRLLPGIEGPSIRFASAGPVSRTLAGGGIRSRVWYRAVLCDSRIRPGDLSIISTHFADALDAAGWPDGACLFMSGTAIFFSPAAIAAVPHLIAVSGASPGRPPDRADATLLAGSEADWDLLPYPIH